MVWEKRYMCIGKIIKNVFVFLKFGGLGILIFVYFIVSKTWQDLKKPVPVESAEELSEGEIVTFYTILRGDKEISGDWDGQAELYCYEGTIGSDPVTLAIPQDVIWQIKLMSVNQFKVIGKVRKTDDRNKSMYVEVLREDYKNSAIHLFGMAAFFLVSGVLTMLYTYRMRTEK